MKKRILSLSLAAVLLFGLCACSAKAAPDEGNTLAASIQPLQPIGGSDAGTDDGASAASDAAGEDAADGFERARLWDVPLDAVVADFAAVSAQTVMGGGENAVFSPVSVYLTLGTVTDGADGDTYDQLMDVLGAAAPGDAIPYREVDDFFWQVGNYSGSSGDYAFWMADGASGEDEGENDGEAWTSALQVADSVWLGEGRAFRESFVNNAETNWYAETFGEVPFGTEEADEAFNAWVLEATGGKVALDYQTAEETALLAASAAYLRDGWLDSFDPQDTADDTFTRADGTAVQTPFMHNSYTNNGYHQGEGYTQTVLFLTGGAEMHFVLPDEDATLEGLLADPAALSAMLRHQYTRYGDIDLALPQFSFTSSPPVADAVKAMGATDAFDPALADFSGMLAKGAEGEGLYLSDLVHEAYIAVNENGVEAAAATVAEAATTGLPMENASALDISLDRPFLFFIRYQGMPLFVGVVNDPTAQNPAA